MYSFAVFPGEATDRLHCWGGSPSSQETRLVRAVHTLTNENKRIFVKIKKVGTICHLRNELETIFVQKQVKLYGVIGSECTSAFRGIIISDDTANKKLAQPQYQLFQIM